MFAGNGLVVPEHSEFKSDLSLFCPVAFLCSVSEIEKLQAVLQDLKVF